MNAARTNKRLLAATTFILGSLLFIAPFQTRTATAAGAVAMQVERIVKLALMEYNSAMRSGEPARWSKYFTDNVTRTSPTGSQEGMAAFSDYYAWEFENFEATWTTKRILVSGPVGAVEFEWDAVHKPSGKPVKLDMVAVIELASSGKFQSISFYSGSANNAEYFASAPGAK
ncbi:MAG: nuclear transport factor 2 family protein [Betaproteobacteria bacterium]|nr:MAG: nuclear transport factor 2 family protein [Betaproteobacteria bacterium]